MTRALSTALLAAAVIVASADAQQVAGTSKFSVSGIPVIFKPVRANDVVAVRAYLRGGSANLTRRTAGIEALMLEAAQQGTSKYGKDALNERLVETGTSISAEAGYDYSVLSVRGVRQHWDEAWDLFSQVALHPTFPASEVDLVRSRMLDQLKRIPDNPDSYLSFLADSALYAGHPYAARPGGTPQSLAAIRRDELASWHRRRFTKENLLIVVVGNVSREDVRAKIAETFARLPARGGRAVATSALRPVTPDVVIVKRDLPTNYITGYFSAPPPSHPDFAALRVATDILSNRLFEEVRTKRNLTYAVGAGLGARAANMGSLYVTAVEPDTTLRVIFSEVKRLQEEPVPPSRLAENVATYLTRFWLNQQSSMGQAAQLGAFELVGGGWQNLYRFADAVRRVTPADVSRVARKYMQHGRFAVIGDPAKINRTLFVSF
ncbi:MAG TPA: pitrilysin family protein [Gemmatimonadaceae bacterium]|nr:pitrilysin family protein [Gemmatimonadaceae bacterium]